MQVLLLVLVLGVFIAEDLAPGDVAPKASFAVLLAVMIVPKALAAIGYWLACMAARRRLHRPSAHQTLRKLDRIGSVYRMLVLVLFGLDLYLGTLSWFRIHLGELILGNDLIILAMPLGMLVWGWWAYYPIDRRLREATLMTRLDAGHAIYPIWSRGQYVASQLRFQVGLTVVPLLMILGWVQVLDHFAPANATLQLILVLVGVGVIFLLAPLLVRLLWDTSPLPAGELRRSLLRMCEQHGVGVRQLLLWHTYGGIINAAVIGLLKPIRYILLTDGLIEMVPREQVEAVMAHEIAHVRRHHLFWMGAAAIASLNMLEVGFGVLFVALAHALAEPSRQTGASLAAMGGQWLNSPVVLMVVTAMAALTGWVFVFGWVSRRMERQADTFAVQHLVSQRQPPLRDARGRTLVDQASAQLMIAALGQIAALNNVRPGHFGWRHGSILWRQNHLRDIVGQPVDDLAIDRQIFWIKAATVGCFVLAGIAQALAVHFGVWALWL